MIKSVPTRNVIANNIIAAFVAMVTLVAPFETATAVTAEELAPPAEALAPPAQVITKNVSSARVVSCAIVFPLDQVRFSESQIDECMKSVKVDAVSYIHVIATSSTTGSASHNLYLSNRRAGAIEAYLTNRYPNIHVHAFGGGVNPKFGKVARIFIVENLGKPDDIDAGVQVASIGAPEIIEKTTVQVVTRTEYKTPPRKGIDVITEAGPARTGLSGDVYNYVGARVTAQGKVPFFPKLAATLSHRLLQSNEAVDINATSIGVARLWTFGQILDQEIFYEQSIEGGVLRANGRGAEFGAQASVGVRNRDYRLSFQAGRTTATTTLGLGVGIRM